MDTLYPRWAGIDVHKNNVVACVRCCDRPGKVAEEVHTSSALTADLLALSDWLAERGVTHVAMESAGVYWEPVFNLLGGRVEVILVNAERHRFPLRMHLGHVSHLEELIGRLGGRIEEALAPFAEAEGRLQTIPGVRQRVAEAVLAEIGPRREQFPGADRLAPWAGMCPGNNESAGKRRGGRVTKGDRWLKRILAQAAWAASHTKGTYLQAQYRRLSKRRGVKRALAAVGHAPLVIIYHALKRGTTYAELGADFLGRLEPARLTRQLVKRLEALGHKVTLEPRPAA